jgi:hypothetical protein
MGRRFARWCLIYHGANENVASNVVTRAAGFVGMVSAAGDASMFAGILLR